VLEWLFRNRKTGQITVGQFPNLALVLFLAATVARWLVGSGGRLSGALGAVAAGALLWWAADELLRGVNPWRRLLGAAVLIAQAARLKGG
jgi:hypothetical protein